MSYCFLRKANPKKRSSPFPEKDLTAEKSVFDSTQTRPSVSGARGTSVIQNTALFIAVALVSLLVGKILRRQAGVAGVFL